MTSAMLPNQPTDSPSRHLPVHAAAPNRLISPGPQYEPGSTQPVPGGIRHPLVAQACALDAPRSRGRRLPKFSFQDPDQMVVLSGLVSVMVLPFLL